MNISCVIVDDESLARKGLEKYVETIDFLELKGVCNNAMQANTLLVSEDIDLLFMDIEMPLISGMEFLKSLSNPPMVIFTTAYSEYALESFQFDVIDYLVKPISPQRFLMACNKAYRALSVNKPENVASQLVDNESDDFIFVKVDKELVKIDFEDILFIESMQNYVKFNLKGISHIVLVPLKNVMNILPNSRFLQVHKSYVIAMSKVDAISGNQIVIENQKIPISRNFKETVMSALTKNKVLKK